MLTAPSEPITAISAVGHAKFASVRMCLLAMTQYAPPYAFRVITVTFGTVASANAYSSFAPLRMMPPHSCTVPGRNPGTSSKVTSGMLKASQNLTKRAPFTDASMSRQPARCAGWFATMPTERPPNRANPTMMLRAKCSCTSRKCASSTTWRMTSTMSYGWLGLAGTIESSASFSRVAVSPVSARGASSRLLDGRKPSSSRTSERHSRSSAAAKCATPLFALCVIAPPSSSFVTSSWVTDLMTSGPVTNM